MTYHDDSLIDEWMRRRLARARTWDAACGDTATGRSYRIPPFLARTGVFAPTNQGLCGGTEFRRLSAIPWNAFILLRGRELGARHRALLYAVFHHPIDCFDRRRSNCAVAPAAFSSVTWRSLLSSLDLPAHADSIRSYYRVLQDLAASRLFLYMRGDANPEASHAEGIPVDQDGFSEPLIRRAACTGMKPEDEVSFEFGAPVARAFESGRLVAVNRKVFCRLRTDGARVLWPVIDGRTEFYFLHETLIADFWGVELGDLDWRRMQKFRERIERGFNDMKSAGGITGWRRKPVKRIGRRQLYRYEYDRT